MKDKKRNNRIQIVNIKDNSVLIFKLKGRIDEEDGTKLRNRITEQTKCRCLLLGDEIDLISVLNVKENTPHQNLKQKNC